METQTTQQTPSALPVETTAGGVSNSSPTVIPVDKEKGLKWAKLYLALGWSLIPVSPNNTKVPALHTWIEFNDRKATLEEVTGWINKGFYLAVVTGKISGIVVVDDDRNKIDLPPMVGVSSPLVATTQSGGLHYYFKWDERDLHTHVNSTLHVDFKGYHSYVLLPPWKNRKWKTENIVSGVSNLEPMPVELDTLLRSDLNNTVNTPLNIKDVLEVSEGSRSDSLFRAACSIFNKADFDTGKTLLIAVNDGYHPPLKDKQRDYDIQRAWDFVQSHPKSTIISVSTELKSTMKGVETTGKEIPATTATTSPAVISEEITLLSNTTFLSTTYPPTKWLVEGLIRIGGISILAGESGTGKTICALTIAKAVSEGKSWLDMFPCPQLKVLIIDKENTPSDIQKHFRTMGIRSPDIFLFYRDDDYQIIDSKAKLTPVAKQLQKLIHDNNIGLVIFDSAIDFVLGDENDSRTIAANINAWKEMCGQATILTIHHESKPSDKGKKKAQDRLRGSSHWLAASQSVLSLSVFSVSHPELLMVEHSKVRSARKHKPFEVEMVIRPDPTQPIDTKETVVTGYKYLREIEPAVLKTDTMVDKIMNYLNEHTEIFFSVKALTEALDEDPTNPRTRETIKFAADKLVSTGDLIKGGSAKKGDPTTYKRCVSDMLEEVIKKEENEQLAM